MGDALAVIGDVKLNGYGVGLGSYGHSAVFGMLAGVLHKVRHRLAEPKAVGLKGDALADLAGKLRPVGGGKVIKGGAGLFCQLTERDCLPPVGHRPRLQPRQLQRLGAEAVYPLDAYPVPLKIFQLLGMGHGVGAVDLVVQRERRGGGLYLVGEILQIVRKGALVLRQPCKGLLPLFGKTAERLGKQVGVTVREMPLRLFGGLGRAGQRALVFEYAPKADQSRRRTAKHSRSCRRTRQQRAAPEIFRPPAAARPVAVLRKHPLACGNILRPAGGEGRGYLFIGQIGLLRKLSRCCEQTVRGLCRRTAPGNAPGGIRPAEGCPGYQQRRAEKQQSGTVFQKPYQSSHL